MGDTLSNNWTDLDIGHGFHETKQGARFTISEPARREVLQRLLKLNHERYAEEVQPGLHAKQRGAGTGEEGHRRRIGIPARYTLQHGASAENRESSPSQNS